MERIYFADNVKYLREEHKITQEDDSKVKVNSNGLISTFTFAFVTHP